MTRVGLLTIGSRGDVEPFVALALALQRQGADVRLVTHARFRPMADRYQVPFASLPGDPAELMATAAGRRALTSGRNVGQFLTAFRQLTEHMALPIWDAAAAAMQDRDVLIYSTFAFHGHYLAKHLGMRAVAAHLQPLLPTGAFTSPAMPFPLPGPLLKRWSHAAALQMFWRQARAGALRLTERVPGLVVPRDIPFADVLRGEECLVAVSPAVVPRPRDWPPEVHLTGYWRLPPQPDFTPPPGLAAFLEDGPPPVYVGFGSLAQPEPDRVRSLVDAALARVGRRGVVNSGWSGIAGVDSSTVHVVEDVPHAWLFPRMAAVVHHGGAGTIAAALCAGVPSVVVPHFGDQWFWAECVQRLGAGVSVARQRLTVDALAAAITAALGRPFPVALRTRLAEEDGADAAARIVLRG